ncbi:cupin domain-containing protein [Capillimicrobium parvum]|uniref:Cupin domain-containing protein n=1 Tax=Capillimicrobium parvum TaxID=2884022 RepID=A0A9E7C3K1_9ACTN|nr:hypothetical protein [Capillimicrobium parvum]UGS38428.1 hypothetical protein DSM104329_04856 [Capillimicrobium parvum]
MTDAPPRPPYEVAHLTEIAHSPSGPSHSFQLVGEWKQVRHHFAITEFAANAFVATAAGQEIVHEHFERPNDDQSDIGDEELYYIASGSAVVKLDDEVRDVGEGTFVFIGDPFVVRSVTAKEPGTVVLTFGTNPGVAFAVSDFEKSVTPSPRWSDPGRPVPRA